jgi:hypothetical protein
MSLSQREPGVEDRTNMVRYFFGQGLPSDEFEATVLDFYMERIWGRATKKDVNKFKRFTVMTGHVRDLMGLLRDVQDLRERSVIMDGVMDALRLTERYVTSVKWDATYQYDAAEGA